MSVKKGEQSLLKYRPWAYSPVVGAVVVATDVVSPPPPAEVSVSIGSDVVTVGACEVGEVSRGSEVTMVICLLSRYCITMSLISGAGVGKAALMIVAYFCCIGW
jgi:hypothetical protein